MRALFGSPYTKDHSILAPFWGPLVMENSQEATEGFMWGSHRVHEGFSSCERAYGMLYSGW